MSSNLLCLSRSKTEFIIIGLSAQIKKIPDPSIQLSNNSASTTFTSDAPVRNLGIIFDPHTPLQPYLQPPRSCFMHICDLNASDPCLTLKLPPPSPSPSSILI